MVDIPAPMPGTHPDVWIFPRPTYTIAVHEPDAPEWETRFQSSAIFVDYMAAWESERNLFLEKASSGDYETIGFSPGQEILSTGIEQAHRLMLVSESWFKYLIKTRNRPSRHIFPDDVYYDLIMKGWTHVPGFPLGEQVRLGRNHVNYYVADRRLPTESARELGLAPERMSQDERLMVTHPLSYFPPDVTSALFRTIFFDPSKDEYERMMDLYGVELGTGIWNHLRQKNTLIRYSDLISCDGYNLNVNLEAIGRSEAYSLPFSDLMEMNTLESAWRDRAWDSYDEDINTQYHGWGVTWPSIHDAVNLFKNRDSWIQNWLNNGPVHAHVQIENLITSKYVYKCPNTSDQYFRLERRGRPFEIGMIFSGLVMGLETMLAPVFSVYDAVSGLYAFLTDQLPPRLKAFADLGLSIVVAKITAGFIGYAGWDKKDKMVAMLNGMAKTALKADFDARGRRMTSQDEEEYVNQHNIEAGELLEGFDNAVDDRTKVILAAIHEQVAPTLSGIISRITFQATTKPDFTKESVEHMARSYIKLGEPGISSTTLGIGIAAAALLYKYMKG